MQSNHFQRLVGRGAIIVAVGMFSLGGCAQKPTATKADGNSAGQTPVGATSADAKQLYARGAQAYRAGDQSMAIADLEAAVAADPKLIMARERLGDAYKATNRYDDALTQYQEVTRLDPYGPTSWYKLGVAQQLVGKPEEAAQSYQRALKLDSRDWRARMNLGLVHLSRGNTSEAVNQTREATKAAPNEADAWSNYGVALDAAGQASDAEQAYGKALELKRHQPGTLINLAQNLLLQNKPDEAIPLLVETVQLEDSSLARRLYGDALKMQNKPDQAQAQYERAETLRQSEAGK